MSILAITGGTGFLGRRLIDLAVEAGHQVRALTRRPQSERTGVTWIEGALNASNSLTMLARGADAIIHVAGVVNAADRAGFGRGNIDGTAAIVAAARKAGIARFIHVSSLSAREPGLSDYGWSKAMAEDAVRSSGLDWTIVRPPGIYGPGDTEIRDMFRLARWGLALLPPPGRASWIEVGDIARLLLALAANNPGQIVLEPDDGVPDGWSHVAFARAIAAAVGRRGVVLSLPRALLSAGAWIDRRARGTGAKLTPDRVAYFCHPDWVVDPAKRPPPGLWRPQVPTPEGLATTAASYRANGLL